MIKENERVMKKKETIDSTDKYLQISEIRWDTIIMKDGWLRAIIKCSWLNINLKNAEEQQIVAERYSRFLNSLDFPIQIVLRSTYLDLSDYLNYIKKNIDKINNEVLRWQWEQYFEFLKKLNDSQGLLFTKEFYVIVPYYSFDDQKKIRQNQFEKIMSALTHTETAENIANKLRQLHKDKKHLNQRCILIQNWLQWIWLEAKRLDLEEIVALLFEVYNPLAIKKQSEILIR